MRFVAATTLALVATLIVFVLGPCRDDPEPLPSIDSLPTAVTTPAAATTAVATSPASTSTSVPTTSTPAAAACETKNGRDEAAEALVPLSTVVLRITSGGTSLRDFTYDEFASFTFDCIDASNGSGRTDDANQSGPQLVDLIGAAGFASWTSIEITGVVTTNNDLGASATVSFAEASQGWLLTIDKSGQVRFPDPRGTGRDDWISMISEIAVVP